MAIHRKLRRSHPMLLLSKRPVMLVWLFHIGGLNFEGAGPATPSRGHHTLQRLAATKQCFPCLRIGIRFQDVCQHLFHAS